MILPAASLEAAVAGRVRRHVEEAHPPGAGSGIALSGGGAQRRPGEAADALVRRAGARLHRARQEGRNLVRGGPQRSAREGADAG